MRMIGALGLNAVVALVNGVSLLAVTPLYLKAGGYELLGVVSFYVAVTLATQFFDGGFALTATRALARRTSYKSFLALERGFYKYVVFFLMIALIFLQAINGEITTPISYAGVLIGIFVHQMVYFYSQCALGGGRHSIYALIFLSYSIGRHILLISTFNLTGDINLAFYGLGIFGLSILITRKNLISNLTQTLAKDEVDFGSENIYARGIMWGSIAAGLLAATDRLLAEFIFDSSIAGAYFAAFVVANTLSLIPIPVYRVFFTSMSKNKDVSRLALEEDINLSGYLVTSLTSILGYLIFISSDWLLFNFLGQYSDSQIIIVKILILFFSGISIGWMPATALQACGLQYIQTWAIGTAVCLGGLILLTFFNEAGIMVLTAIWGVHACVQALFIPTLAFHNLKIKFCARSFKCLYASPLIFWLACLNFEFNSAPESALLAVFFAMIYLILVYDLFKEINKKTGVF